MEILYNSTLLNSIEVLMCNLESIKSSILFYSNTKIYPFWEFWSLLRPWNFTLFHE